MFEHPVESHLLPRSDHDFCSFHIPPMYLIHVQPYGSQMQTLRWHPAYREGHVTSSTTTTPPRRTGHAKHIPLHHPSALESMDARLKRLRPEASTASESTDAHAASGPNGTPAVKACTRVPPNPSPYTRSDAPVARNTRWGSASDALSSSHVQGKKVLIEELLQDRLAKSGVASSASLLVTWRRLHEGAFKNAVPPVEVLPITVQGLVTIGSMFKSGRCRPRQLRICNKG